MRFQTLRTIVCAVALAAAPASFAPSAAATAAEVRPGMVVVDPSGGTVGTVTAVKGDNLVLKTDRHELHVPLSSFTAHEGKLMFGMTAAQLNAEADKQIAAAAAAVAVGAEIYGSDGTLAGKIKAIDTDLVTIEMVGGATVRVPRSGVAGGAKGATLGVTTAQLKELASQAGGAARPAVEATAEATPEPPSATN